jgi:hypothetical protein
MGDLASGATLLSLLALWAWLTLMIRTYRFIERLWRPGLLGRVFLQGMVFVVIPVLLGLTLLWCYLITYLDFD